MMFPRSVYIEEDVWDELMQQGFERSAVEGRQVNASELARRGIHRELAALADEREGRQAYSLPAGYDEAADVARQEST